MTQSPRSGVIKSVQKSLEILKYIMNSPDEVSLSELEKEFEYNISTMHHLLRTMMIEGFISQNVSTKKYDIGPEFFFSWLGCRQREKYFERALPILEEFVSNIGETTNMFIIDGNEAVCVIGSESKQTLRAFLTIGRRIPLPCTAVGKVFLAYMDEKELREIIMRIGLKKYMPRTITDIDALIRELEETKIRGYSIEIEEFEEMITAIGVPIFDSKGNVISAISTLIPSIRANREKIITTISSLTKVSKIIGELLRKVVC